MKVAFYAPLKSPDHPVPSGDRQMARGLLQALRAGGHEAYIASRFRSFDRHGDPARQTRLRLLGERVAQRLIARYRRAGEPPELWFTYHLYHKAPDWVGPAVSHALTIPYVVAEASVANKQRDGPWAPGFAASVDAMRAADAVIFLNPRDVAGVCNLRSATQARDLLPPFMDLAAFTRSATSAAAGRVEPLQLITVAMMREGAKLASYRLLAAALQRIGIKGWNLVVVGDGPARPEVEAAFAGIDASRIRFVGAQPPGNVAAWLRASDLFLWPAIGEAFGMVFIEAQACGLPVVGGNTGGVAAVVADGRTGLLVPTGDIDAFAAATRYLMMDTEQRRRMACEAVRYVAARHDLPAAAGKLDAILRRVHTDHVAMTATAHTTVSAQ